MATRNINFSVDRPDGTSVLNNRILDALNAWNLPRDLDQGIILHPVRLPRDFDNSRPANMRFWYNGFGTISGGSIVFRMRWNVARPVPPTTSVIFDWVSTPPNPLFQSQVVDELIDDGSGVTFPPHSFNQDDTLGVTVYRQGTDPADTVLQLCRVCANMVLEYTPLCARCCCP
jgi:hypothetical protein